MVFLQLKRFKHKVVQRKVSTWKQKAWIGEIYFWGGSISNIDFNLWLQHPRYRFSQAQYSKEEMGLKDRSCERLKKYFSSNNQFVKFISTSLIHCKSKMNLYNSSHNQSFYYQFNLRLQDSFRKNPSIFYLFLRENSWIWSVISMLIFIIFKETFFSKCISINVSSISLKITLDWRILVKSCAIAVK